MPVTPKRPAGCAAGRCSPMAAAGPRTAPGITAAMSNKPSAKGMSNGPEKGLVGQAVLGSRNFIEELTKRVRGIRAEASAGAISVAARRFRRRLETDRRCGRRRRGRILFVECSKLTPIPPHAYR